MMVQEDELIDFCRQLIRVPSLSGNEKQLAELILNKLTALGFDEAWIDSNGSVLGKINGTEPGPVLLLDGHIDTVPAGDIRAWSVDPFGAEMANGRIYGRGTSDMKGSMAAMICAAAQLKKNGSIQTGSLVVSGTVCEEAAEGAALKTVMEQIKPDYVIIGKPTGLNLNIGQRGRAEIEITAAGRMGHTFNPQTDANAILQMLPFLNKLNGLSPSEHSELGRGISAATGIRSSPFCGLSVMPEQCVLTLERRLLIHEDMESILQAFRELGGGELQVELADRSVLTYTGQSIGGLRWYPAWMTDVDHPLVQKSLRALLKTNLSPKISFYQLSTSGSYSAGTAGVPTIGFGPSYEHMAHIADEYIEIGQLIHAANGFYFIVKALLAGEESVEHS